MMISVHKNDVELQKNVQMVIKLIFLVKEAGSLYFHNRLCVPDDEELKKKLLFQAYNTVFTIPP